MLIVDERGSSTIDTFVVDHRGVAGPAHTTPSNAGGSFGFDVDRRGHILFSAVALGGGLMSGATSYDVARDGTLTPNGGPVYLRPGGGVLAGRGRAFRLHDQRGQWLDRPLPSGA